MPRLILHAGFPKTGSSAIQAAISRNLAALEAAGFPLFGCDMTLGPPGVHPGLPLWHLEEADRTWEPGRTLTAGLLAAMEGQDGTFLVTSENLNQTGMPRLFHGIDGAVETEVVFYMRPQTAWIPSAWKQWFSKRGTPLAAFVEDCLRQGYPANAASLKAWAAGLPRARITVRPFFPEMLAEGDPGTDFLRHIGFKEPVRRDADEVVNPSLDYVLQHLLMLNARAFADVHDNALSDRLAAMVPPRYRRANIAMLSNEAAARVEARFREENLAILRTYCGLADPERFYRAHFVPRPAAATYMDTPEPEILARAFAILYETLGRDWAAGVLAEGLGALTREAAPA